MRKNIFLILGLPGILLSACSQPGYECVNPSASDVSDKLFVLNRAEVAKLASFGDGDFISVATASGDLLPSQMDDLDGDGSWDELAFIIDLKASEKQKVTFHGGEPVEFEMRTNLRFGSALEPHDELTGQLRLKSNDSPSISAVYQMEGPAWENDKVGFRNYYDARNGIDIFGKSVTRMALDGAGIRGQNYHELSDWGMDVLKVGNSLGAGAIAIGVGDSIYRVGPCREGHCQFIVEGPVRSILELTYLDVPAGDRRYNVKHRITIAAGDLGYQSQVWVDGLKGDECLVTGIVDKHALEAVPFVVNGFRGFYTHGAQAYTSEMLGMAVASKADQIVAFAEAPETGDGVVETHLLKLKLMPDVAAQYYFFSGWEYQDKGFAAADLFEAAVKQNLTKF